MNKMNNYIYMFLAFVVVIIIAFVGFTYQSHRTGNADAKDKSGNEVVITKNPATPEQKANLLKSATGDIALGSQYAPVTIIEYASLSCPHCAHLAENVIEPMQANYIDKGKVKYVFRDFPLNAQAVAASKLTHCVAPEQYYSFVKVLFKSQEQWAYNENFMNLLKNIAKLGGVTPEKFDSCQKDKSLEDSILKTEQDAIDILNVTSTPTVFINGNQFKGTPDYKTFTAEIDKQLKGEVK